MVNILLIGNSSRRQFNGDMKTVRRILLCLVAAAMLPGAPAVADDDDNDDMRAARAAMAAGEIRPLADLLAQVEAQCDGRFVEMELDHDDGRWIYEIKLLGPSGDVAELEYDAHDLTLLEAEGRRLNLLGCVPPGTPS